MNDFKHRILLIDDDPTHIALLKKILNDNNYEVQIALNGREGLDAVSENKPDLILLDINMPDLNGFQVCEQLKSNKDTEEIPVLFLSNLMETQDITKALKTGGVDYITKPFSREEVLARIKVHLKIKQLNSQLERSNNYLTSIFNQQDIGILLIDKNTNIIFFNQFAEYIFGRNLDELKSVPISQLPFKKDDLNRFLVHIKNNQQGIKKLPVHIKNFKSQNVWLEVDIKQDSFDNENTIFFMYDVSELVEYRERFNRNKNAYDIIGNSQAINELMNNIYKIASAQSTVLIVGETGSGKELVARAIHNNSNRKDSPFITINCAELTETLLQSQLFGYKKGAFTGAYENRAGLFEAANGGTIFLDEIGDMPASLQAKLLRVLEEKEVLRIGETQARQIDVRVLTATNKTLESDIEKNNFRKDLYYRINTNTIRIPPLRDRKEDIPLLSKYFLDKFNYIYHKQIKSIEPSVYKVLKKYDWSGNVRELKNSIESAVTYCETGILTTDDLPFNLKSSLKKQVNETDNSLKQEINEYQRQKIVDILKQTAGNKTQAAKLLGITPRTLFNRMKKYNLS